MQLKEDRGRARQLATRWRKTFWSFFSRHVSKVLKLSLKLRIIYVLLLFLCTAVLVVLAWFCFSFVIPWNKYSVGRDPCMVAATEFVPRLNPRLPKIVHQQWYSDPIEVEPQKTWRNTVLNLFPQHEHMLWTDEKARQLIETKYPWFLSQYDSYDKNIKRVDVARYFCLYDYVGLFFDSDYEPLTNFWDRLPDDSPTVIQSPLWRAEKIQNSFMSSPRRHEFWNVTFGVLLEPERKTYGVIEATGPIALQDAIAKYKKKVGVLPCENWFRKPEKDLYHPYRDHLLIYNFWILPCGNVDDLRCQFGRHHSTTVYDERVTR